MEQRSPAKPFRAPHGITITITITITKIPQNPPNDSQRVAQENPRD